MTGRTSIAPPRAPGIRAAQPIARLRERPVAGEHLVAAHAHGGGRAAGREALAAEHDARRGGLAAERLVRGHHVLEVLRRRLRPTRLVAVDREQVLHLKPSVCRRGALRATFAPYRRG